MKCTSLCLLYIFIIQTCLLYILLLNWIPKMWVYLNANFLLLKLEGSNYRRVIMKEKNSSWTIYKKGILILFGWISYSEYRRMRLDTYFVLFLIFTIALLRLTLNIGTKLFVILSLRLQDHKLGWESSPDLSPFRKEFFSDSLFSDEYFKLSNYFFSNQISVIYIIDK